MSSMDAKLEKIREAINLAKQGITYDEFLKHFKSLIELVKKIESNLITNIDGRTKEATQRLTELESLYQETISRIENDNESTISNLKRWALEKVGEILINSEINQKLEERLNQVDNKLTEINSIPIPNSSVIALEASKMALDEVLPLIPPKIDLGTELPKLGEPIRDALELLQGDERLDKSAIKGLQEELDRILKIAESKTQIIGGGGVGKQNVYYYDLSSQLNGVLKTFSMPAFARILDVKLSSAPVLRPTVDWTSDANAYTITFTSQIDADPLLNSGQSLLVLYAI